MVTGLYQKLQVGGTSVHASQQVVRTRQQRAFPFHSVLSIRVVAAQGLVIGLRIHSYTSILSHCTTLSSPISIYQHSSSLPSSLSLSITIAVHHSSAQHLRN